MDNKTLMDVGCGVGLFGYTLLTTTDNVPQRMIGVDVWEPYITRLRRTGIYDALYVQKVPPLPTEPVDVITCIEVIEHLSQGDAITLLTEMKNKAEFVIITTPLDAVGYRPKYTENQYQHHRTQITEAMLRNLGYNTRVEDSIGMGRVMKILRWVKRRTYNLHGYKTIVAWWRREAHA